MANIGTAPSAIDLTSTGTTQATALEVLAERNFFSTVAADTGALLSSLISAGEVQSIYNGGANGLKVYPPSTMQINELAVNAAMLLPSKTTCEFMRISPTRWTGILSQ